MEIISLYINIYYQNPKNATKAKEVQILNSFSGPKVESSGFYFKLEFIKIIIVLKKHLQFKALTFTN